MRLRILAVLALPFLLSTGCLSRVHDQRPFTKAWQHEIEHEKAFQERRAKIDKKDPSKLKGDGGAIGQEYDDGKPLIGSANGVGANVDMNGNAIVQYGVRW
jgi:hypothetical protein